MSDFLLAQLIVSVALLFDLSSVQMRKREHLVIGQAIAASLIATHFFIMGYNTEGAVFLVGCLRLLISLKWRNRLVQATAYGFIVAVTLFTYQGFLSLLSCAASLLMAIGAFAPSLRQLRLFFIAGSSTWLLHNILAWTPIGILMELLFLSSNLVGYYRFFVRKPA